MKDQRKEGSMITQSTQSVDHGPEDVNELARMFWHSAILRAGIKLNVFPILDKDSLTYDELAESIGASPRYVHAFVDSCVVLGLLGQSGGKYHNSPSTSRFLVKGKQEYVGDHALHHTNTWASWGRLDEVIKEGKTLLPFETGYVDTATYWTNYMMGQHNRAASGQADQLVRNVDLSGKRRLLDLGGGTGSYSIALCDANPELSAVVADQKEPLRIAGPLVEEHNLQGRITLLEGDFFETDLGGDYDVVLISGVLLIKPEEACRRLMKLAYDLLVPEGVIIIQDYMRMGDSPERKKLDTLENMYVLVVFDPGAGDREGEEMASWLGDAGFENIKLIPVPTQLSIISAEKPALL